MRIAVITSQFPVAGDPARGRPVLQTLEALAKRVRLEVFVPNARYPAWLAPRSYRYVPPTQGTEQLHGVTAHHISYPTLPVIGRLSNGHCAGRSLSAPVRNFRPDLLLAYWLYPDAFGAAAVARELRVPLVSGARGSDIRARDPVSLALTRRVLAQSARVLTVSADLRRIAAERFGVPPDRITTVPNGCNTNIFRVVARAAARKVLGLSAEGQLVLFTGRITAAKGVRELLAAWIDLATDDETLRLAAVGDGPLRNELVRGAAAAGMSERLHLPGILSAEEVALWMQACDVFCLPSHTEGYPNVLIEALACGRPVVATAVGGIPEIVDHDNGLLTPVGDVGGLAAALRTALAQHWDEAALSRRFGRSWDDVADETLAVCEAALDDAAVSDPASSPDRSTSRTTS